MPCSKKKRSRKKIPPNSRAIVNNLAEREEVDCLVNTVQLLNYGVFNEGSEEGGRREEEGRLRWDEDLAAQGRGK
jgi:hypothetical protein